MQDIKESDWKIFKGLRQLALERFCDRVLGEIAGITSDNTKTKPERYRAIYRQGDQPDIRFPAAIHSR